jgi:hypothetical protein
MRIPSTFIGKGKTMTDRQTAKQYDGGSEREA